MRHFDKHWLRPNAAKIMVEQAMSGTWNGRALTEYFKKCCFFYVPDCAEIILTRDIGYHTGGWWKNPDYERCFHMSMSFKDPIYFEPKPHDEKVAGEWLELLFAGAKSFVWVEPASSQEARRLDVRHYRLFVDEKGQPILPRDEVYTRHFTERHWKSFSEVMAKEEAERKRREEMEMNQ